MTGGGVGMAVGGVGMTVNANGAGDCIPGPVLLWRAGGGRRG